MWLFYVKACYPGPEKWYRRNDTDMTSNSNSIFIVSYSLYGGIGPFAIKVLHLSKNNV